jgi:hypothetical protein
MDLGPLRLLSREASMSVMGVDATVTVPSGAPVQTRVVWVNVATEQMPYGRDFQARDPRRVLVISRAAVPLVPRGTTIAAPEYAGATVRTWTVDNVERMDADEARVIVAPAL